MSKNVITFGFYMSSSVDIDNKGKGILILGIGPTEELDNTMLAAEAQYSINFSRSNRKFFIKRTLQKSLHYNGSNSFLIVNSTKIYQFLAKDSEMKKYTCI